MQNFSYTNVYYFTKDIRGYEALFKLLKRSNAGLTLSFNVRRSYDERCIAMLWPMKSARDSNSFSDAAVPLACVTIISRNKWGFVFLPLYLKH